MANNLNQIFKDTDLKGRDVKNKITYLTSEYRRRKKEMGSTGGSPSPWPYFDLIDKLLGKNNFLFSKNCDF
jgi:hypothetical protein